MRIKLSGVRKIYIRDEFIRLDALLKFASVVSTGGEAKILILDGCVFLGGVACTQRGKKVRPGDVVRCGDSTLIVCAADRGELQMNVVLPLDGEI